jgi:hypothetical protein
LAYNKTFTIISTFKIIPILKPFLFMLQLPGSGTANNYVFDIRRGKVTGRVTFHDKRYSNCISSEETAYQPSEKHLIVFCGHRYSTLIIFSILETQGSVHFINATKIRQRLSVNPKAFTIFENDYVEYETEPHLTYYRVMRVRVCSGCDVTEKVTRCDRVLTNKPLHHFMIPKPENGGFHLIFQPPNEIVYGFQLFCSPTKPLIYQIRTKCLKISVNLSKQISNKNELFTDESGRVFEIVQSYSTDSENSFQVVNVYSWTLEV